MNRLSRFQTALVQGVGSLVAPGGARGSCLILIYHRVLAETDPMIPDEPDAREFDAQMDLVSRTHTVIPLTEVVERISSGSLPPRAACITFDDGYANNLTVAAPILQARRIPATVFVSTGYTGGGRMFNDTVIECVRRAPAELDLTDLGLKRYELPDFAARRRAVDELLPALKYFKGEERLAKARAIAERVGADLPDDLMMTADQIRLLSKTGVVEIGSHTVSHPILTRLEGDRARKEITDCKHTLESITGSPVRTFAYPNGRPNKDYDKSHVEMVRQAGYTAAVSTSWGAAGRGSDPLQLPRMLPWDQTPLKFAARMLRTHTERTAAVA